MRGRSGLRRVMNRYGQRTGRDNRDRQMQGGAKCTGVSKIYDASKSPKEGAHSRYVINRDR